MIPALLNYPLEIARNLFHEDALQFLFTYSGGSVRYLMTFVQNACSYARQVPVPLEAAHYAIKQTVATYAMSIQEKYWRRLAQLEISPDQKIPGGDDDYVRMLIDLSVLEYLNGGTDDPFAGVEPWYAVNPIVRELDKFKTALNALGPRQPAS